jgi:adenylate kinase family enzyme
MSFNLEKCGAAFARIEGGSNDGKKLFLASPDDKGLKEHRVRSFTRATIPDGDTGQFRQMINPKTERQIWYVVGASGSGKSYYTKMICKEYTKKFPDRNVYMFSSLPDDVSVDDIKNLKRPKIDDTLVSDPIDASEFAESMVIFDDCDTLTNKAQRKEVFKILDQILQTGRHHKISCVLTFHLPSDRQTTRQMLNECHFVTIFPKSVMTASTKYVLENYIGITPKMMKEIKKLSSRWVTIAKNYPQAILSEKCAYILEDPDLKDDD